MTWRATILILVAVLLGGATGCEHGFKVGESWLVRPHSTTSATHVHLSRYEYEKGDARGDPLVLMIDLFTGHALLNEPGGRVFPSQLSAETAQNLRDIVAKRTFGTARIRPLRRAKVIRDYEMVIYDGDIKLAAGALWSTPPFRALLRPHTRLTAIFERAYRMVHPLSNRVDLVE